MTQTIRVPDPVYRKLKEEADRRDVAMGVVVADWMEQAGAAGVSKNGP